ncbi:MAG: tetratricopeptide repeat protein [Alphaproteobacteria bacterium]|nr:tetratricopeptide repeat protein [Alphaproteobacteria bacterium]
MKKVKNTRKTKATAVKPAVKTPVVENNNSWSWTIYMYWFIILFFIASTFYILGRSHEFFHPAQHNVIVTEEVLQQSEDYINVAKVKLSAGNIEEAIEELNSAIDADAASNTYVLRGEAYMQLGEYQKALADFDSAIEKDSMNAVAFYDRSLLNTRLENYEAALSDINNALAAQSMKPSDVLSMRNLYAKRGQLNLWLKNWQGAIADYTNSLARAEGSISASVYAERAEAYTAMGEYQKAIDDYTSAVRVISEQIQGSQSQAERESQSSNAMSYFEKSAALNLKLGNDVAARNDLESAFAIAVALNDEESTARIQNLINGLE